MNNQRVIQMLTFYDKILITAILLIAALLYWILALDTWKSPDDIAVVRQNGTVIFQLTKEKLEKDGIYSFQFDKGIGSIEVKNKKIRLLPMDKSICPKAVCSDTGWIKGNPNAIVCMPNRLVVSFTSNKDSKLDVVTY